MNPKSAKRAPDRARRRLVVVVRDRDVHNSSSDRKHWLIKIIGATGIATALLFAPAVIPAVIEAVLTRSIVIAPLLVPQEVEHRGITSIAAAQRLRDELR